MLGRRQILRAGLVTAAAMALPGCRFTGSRPPPFPLGLPSSTPWPEANEIVASLARPIFPSRIFPIAQFGARGDGRANDTAAISQAIDACTAAGGGRVLVPEGEWITGAIRLRRNVELHLARNATLLFSGDSRLYPIVLTRYEGIECVNRSPMIYALDESNIAITGSGVLDASNTAGWNTGDDREGILDPMVASGIPADERLVAGRLRTSFIEPYRCATVLIEGVTLRGAQFWQLHPTLCTDVTIEGVTTTVSGENTDACDPESCNRVLVQRCTLASGDDNLAIKSGRDADGRRVNVPCKNVVIMNNQAEGRFGFITLGSEQTGGIESVYAFNNWTYGQGAGSALWIKSSSQRGGYSRAVRIDSLRGSGFRSAAIAMQMSYGGETGSFTPWFDDIELSNLTLSSAPMALDLEGLPSRPIGGVSLRDSTFTGIDSPAIQIENALPVTFHNVTINGQQLTE